MKKILGMSGVLFFSACATDEAVAPPLAVQRPAGVPAHYVSTPVGWSDPACVHAIGDAGAAACTSITYDHAGLRLDASEAGAPEIPGGSTNGGWIAYASSISDGYVSQMHAQWQVPAAPTANTGQVVYLWTGLQQYTSIAPALIQPVLGYNQLGVSGWSLASWYITNSGAAYHSSPIAVTGTTITGDLQGASCNASTNVCSDWTITTRNGTSGTSTVLHTNAGGVPAVTAPMSWVLAGNLEGYFTLCSDLPAGPSSTFSGIALTDVDGTHPSITGWNDHTLSPMGIPACSYAVAAGVSPKISWNNGSACTPGDDQPCCPYADGCTCDGDQTCSANGTWGRCVGATEKGHVCP